MINSRVVLFKVTMEEELKEIEALGVPELSEAVTAYHTVTTSPEYQEYERLMADAGHNEAQAVYNAEQRGEKRGAEAERAKWLMVAEENKQLKKVAEEKEQLKIEEIERLKAELEQLRKG